MIFSIKMMSLILTSSSTNRTKTPKFETLIKKQCEKVAVFITKYLCF